MKSIKLSEVFRSLQCEGRYVGRPSIFIRAFGCNFTCAGFGMPHGELSQERFEVNPDDYQSFDELPVVTTGCDSYASWDPRFKKFSPKYTVEELSEKVRGLLPNGTWTTDHQQFVHVIFTGGEPLMPGWQKFYPNFLRDPQQKDLKHVTFETNGTQLLNADMADFFNNERPDIHVTFAVAAKLSISGHSNDEAIRPDIVQMYTDQITNSSAFLKFVVGDSQDLDEAIWATKQYNDQNGPYEVYLMPVGGQAEMYDSEKTYIANKALELGFYFSPRLQIDLWSNTWGS